MVVAATSGAQQDAAGSHFTLWTARRVKYIFILPAVIFILGIMIFPLLYSLGTSFTDWNIQSAETSFIGLRNYGQVLTDSRFQTTLARTLAVTVVAVTVELVLGFVIAILLVEPLPGKRIIIPLLVFPAVANPIVVGFIWRVLYNPRFGPINQIIGWLTGLAFDVSWLTSARLAIVAITIAEIWQWTPFMFLILLAGLAAINPELFEAAAMDGASKWQTVIHVTIPVMRPIIVMAVLIRGLDVLKLFDLVFVMTGGGPGNASETISHYIYQLGFRFFRLGYAAAASYVLLIVFSIVVLFLIRQFRERT
jgi:multiple sugar transport system permease protein